MCASWATELSKSKKNRGPFSQGVDVQLSTHAQQLFPYAVECKACERINVRQGSRKRACPTP